MLEYVKGADLPDLTVEWLDSAGTVIDFASGWSFSVKVGKPSSAAAFTKTSGVTGAATTPNLSITWAASGELNSLAEGVWTVQITATRTADNKERRISTTIILRPSVT